jgi:hypothetical protein
MSTAPRRPYSRPVFDQTITIHSDHAQRLLDRGFLLVVRALYGIDVVPMDYVSRMSSGFLRTRAGLGESLLAAEAGRADSAADLLKAESTHARYAALDLAW